MVGMYQYTKIPVYNNITTYQVWFPGEGRNLIPTRCPAVSFLRAELVRSIQNLSPPGDTITVDFSSRKSIKI